MWLSTAKFCALMWVITVCKGRRAPALGGSSGGRHYVRSKPTRGAVGVDGENLRDPVGKQLGRAFDVP